MEMIAEYFAQRRQQFLGVPAARDFGTADAGASRGCQSSLHLSSQRTFAMIHESLAIALRRALGGTVISEQEIARANHNDTHLSSTQTTVNRFTWPPSMM